MTSQLDYVILRNVGGLLADVIPLRCSAAKGGGREAVREGWREGGNPSKANNETFTTD